MRSAFALIAFAVLPALATASTAAVSPIVFEDTSRFGQPFTKDPSVIKFGGRYLMYYSIPAVPKSPDKLWSVGIAESRDLQTWRKVGEMLPAP
eukprot:gene17262-21103_t